jgi:Mg-chelatase subunit ChlD
LFCAHCFSAEKNGCTERTVIVTARDANSGKALPDTLQAVDLRGKINDKPMQILAATKPTTPTRVVLLLDASASMAGKWQRVVHFATDVVRKLPSSTQFALIVFAGNELRKVEFGKPGPEMITEIMSFKGIQPYGDSALRDAIREAVNMFQSGVEGDAIVVVSDGRDKKSKVSMRQLLEAMWPRGIRLTFVQVINPYFADRVEFRDQDDRDVAALSERSGGFLFHIDNPRLLQGTAQEIALEIESYLALRIALPAVLNKEASIHIEAVDPSGRKRKNIELGFPEKLLPCASLTSRQ